MKVDALETYGDGHRVFFVNIQAKLKVANGSLQFLLEFAGWDQRLTLACNA